MDIEQAVEQYRNTYPQYQRFTNRLQTLLEELLQSEHIKFNLEHRTKDVDHFREKLTRPGKSYSNPVNEITDLCGIRIILYRISDVPSVVSILKKEFCIDDKNSVYKAEELKVDQFGYTSVHLVISLLERRAVLSEWRQFEHFKAEIQVRTILQHAWAVISHEFDYKVGADIPREFRRRLFRLSALFELADEELDHLVNEIQKTIENYKKSLDQGITEIELNVDSLRTYIESAEEVQYWQGQVGRIAGKQPANWGDLSQDIKVAKHCGLTNIEDIKKLLESARGWGEEILEKYYDALTKLHGVPRNRVSPTLDGVVNLLIVASNAKRFTPDILEKEFGYVDSVPLRIILNQQ
jgi:putative GTP pyrophosphokinase